MNPQRIKADGILPYFAIIVIDNLTDASNLGVMQQDGWNPQRIKAHGRP